MQGIVGQLGELFLQAVPTVLIISLFYFILRAIFFRPLLKVMAEREARTAGARKAAESAQAAAAEKMKEYQEALKHALEKKRQMAHEAHQHHASKPKFAPKFSPSPIRRGPRGG